MLFGGGGGKPAEGGGGGGDKKDGGFNMGNMMEGLKKANEIGQKTKDLQKVGARVWSDSWSRIFARHLFMVYALRPLAAISMKRSGHRIR